MSVTPDQPFPVVSVVIPAYDSHATIGACLEALARQTFRNFETIVVDSGPDDRTARLVPGQFGWARYERSARRLVPQMARTRGVTLARGPLVAFLDPDVYAGRDWLARLIDAHRTRGDVVVGALACHGRRWRDLGIHLCKFGGWLPGGSGRGVHMAPTASLLAPRDILEAAQAAVGNHGHMLGDVLLTRALLQQRRRLWLEPRAVAAHHHLQSLPAFVGERFGRGREYGALRIVWLRDSPTAILALLAATLIPVRLTRILGIALVQARRAGLLGTFMATLPVILLGHAAALAGEGAAYARRLLLGRAGTGRHGEPSTALAAQNRK